MNPFDSLQANVILMTLVYKACGENQLCNPTTVHC